MSERPLVLISGKDVVDEVGGHSSYVRAHALAGARAGLEPHIFSIGKRTETLQVPFGTVHRVSLPWLRTIPVVLQPFVLAPAVVRFLRGRRGPHLIHGFAIWAAAAVAASRALSRAGVSSVALASAYGTRAYEVGAMQRGLRGHHGFLNRVRYRAWLIWITVADDRVERWGYGNARQVMVNYESVRRILRDAYGPGLDIRRVPYASLDAVGDGAQVPCPPGHGSREALPRGLAELQDSDAPLVLATSRHDPRKGLDVLLLALAELAQSGVRFRACLIGPGRLLDPHRRLSAELGLSGRVSITGQVADVEPYLRRAEVFVLPSLAEASGSISVLEALRSGTAVIASACDGIPEDLRHGHDALLVPPGNPRALAEALRTLLGDPPLRARLGAEALSTHAHRFSATGFGTALERAYSELTDEAARSLIGGSRLSRTASAT
jgi:glycosyltransferase involved in cell wall biosynthesis